MLMELRQLGCTIDNTTTEQTMILVIGSVVVKEGGLEQALAASREHVARSRGEPGCIAHAVHRDDDNPHKLVFVEEWADQAALQQHFGVPASRAFGKLLAGLAVEPPRLAVYDAQKIMSS
jgi:quinol monooxygenase YgiN